VRLPYIVVAIARWCKRLAAHLLRTLSLENRPRVPVSCTQLPELDLNQLRIRHT